MGGEKVLRGRGQQDTPEDPLGERGVELASERYAYDNNLEAPTILSTEVGCNDVPRSRRRALPYSGGGVGVGDGAGAGTSTGAGSPGAGGSPTVTGFGSAGRPTGTGVGTGRGVGKGVPIGAGVGPPM